MYILEKILTKITKNSEKDNLAISSLEDRYSLAAEGKIEEAIPKYKLALKLQPNAQDYLDLGNLLIQLSNVDEALENYHHALALKSDWAEAYYYRGNAYHSINEYEKGIQDYQKALELKPNLTSVYPKIAESFYENKQFEQAIPWLEKSLEIEPDNVETNFQLGHALITAKQSRKKAFASYYKANNIKFKKERSAGIIGRICLASLPKSGTIYIANVLQELIDSCPNASHQDLVYPCGSFPNYFWNLTTQKPYLNNHSILICDHISANSYNKFVFSWLTDRLIVNIRDPRQATLSFIHHLDRVQNSYNDLYHLHQYAQIPEDYFSLSLSEKIDWQIENWYLSAIIQWIDSWIKAEQDSLFYPKILFTKFEDLRNNPENFWKCIFDFYNIDIGRLNMPERPKFKDNTHYRKGQVDEWREVFNLEQIDKINTIIPDYFFTQFCWVK